MLLLCMEPFLVFSPFAREILSIMTWQKGLSSTNLEYDKSQTIYFLSHNSEANFAESVFVIDNYSGSSTEWQTK